MLNLKDGFFLLFAVTLLFPVSIMGISLPWPKLALISFVFVYFLSMDKWYFNFVSKSLVLISLVNCIVYLLHLMDLNYSPNIRDLSVVLSFLESALLISILPLIFNKEYHIQKYFRQISFFICLISVLGILEFLNIFDMKNVLMKFYGSNNELWSEYFKYNIRSSSIFNNSPNTFGLFETFSFVLIFYGNRIGSFHLFWYYFCLILTVIGILFSGSLTAIVILFLLVLFILFSEGKIIRNAAVLLFGFLILGFVFSENVEKIISRQKLDEDIIPSSLKARLNNVWYESYILFEDSPIIGIGPSINTIEFGVDNGYLDIFLRFGFVGGTLFLVFIIFIILRSFLAYQMNSDVLKELYAISFMFSLILSFALISGTFFKDEKIYYLFWIFYCLPFFYESNALRK